MFKFTANLRKDQGKGASRRLRHADKFPAIIYGGTEAPIAIELDHNAIINAQIHEAFYNETIVLNVEGKETVVKVQAMQRHPFKPKVLHIDFVRV